MRALQTSQIESPIVFLLSKAYNMKKGQDGHKTNTDKNFTLTTSDPRNANHGIDVCLDFAGLHYHTVRIVRSATKSVTFSTDRIVIIFLPPTIRIRHDICHRVLSACDEHTFRSE